MDHVTLLFSGIVTLCTLGSALLTVFLLTETRRMRLVQTEPKIDVTYQVREEWIAHLDILVQNIGLGPAHDVRFEVKPFTDDEATHAVLVELTGIGFIRSGLNYLSPGQRVSSFFTNVSENSQVKLRSCFQVKVSYRSDGGRRYEDRYRIDLSELKGLRRVGEPPLYRMAKALEELRLDVHDILEDPAGSSRRRRS